MAVTNAILVNFKSEKEDLKNAAITETKDIHQPLIDACVQNDAQAQKKLYDLYCVAIFNTCKRMLVNRDDAQDVLQETFLDAFRGIKNFTGKSTFGAWLKRIAINKSIDHLNRQKRLHLESLPDNYEGEESDAAEKYEFTVEEINAAILQLPDGCRAVFVLKTLENYDHKEIAQELQITIGTSKSQYNRAKELLKVLLKKTEK